MQTGVLHKKESAKNPDPGKSVEGRVALKLVWHSLSILSP